jgi:hypothetical protein
MTAFGEQITRWLDTTRDWLMRAAPEPLEVLFWVAVLWISTGLLRPVMGGSGLDENSPDRADGRGSAKQQPSPLYPAFRNTLIVVIALFAVYLVFEFNTLWFRVFPDGFHYSGYAHEGAAWLTVALALATVVLSAIFRGDVLRDPRLPKLQRMAWLWSFENLLLALAVYDRLFIHIGFKGLTRMRIIGLGDPAPSVQISVHPLSSERIPLLLPLLECDDPVIREGIHAMLAERLEQAETAALRREPLGWTTYQIADEFMLDRLQSALTPTKRPATRRSRRPRSRPRARGCRK